MARAWAVVVALFDELDQLTAAMAIKKDIRKAVKKGDDEAIAAVVRNASSLAGRSDIAKKLLDALDKAIRLERLVHGMDDKEGGSDHEDAMDEIKRRMG